MIYYTIIPDLSVETLRSCAELFKNKLHRIGVNASLRFFDCSDEHLIDSLPAPPKRGRTLIYDDGNVFYGWDLIYFTERPAEYLEILDKSRVFIGAF